MKKIIFFSLPAHGHTNPTLNVAQELLKLGNDVVYYSTEEFRKKVETVGVPYRSYHDKASIDARIGKNLSLLAQRLVNTSEQEIPYLLEILEKEKPDCISYDTLALWGKFVAKSLNIPAVSFYTTFAFNNTLARHYPHIAIPMMTKALIKGHHGISALNKYKKLCTKYGLNNNTIIELMVTKEKLNIVFTSSQLQPCVQSFDHTYKFVGTSIAPRNEKADFLKTIHKERKLIYISLGTIFNDNLKFYRTCLEAFRDTPYQIILSLGQRFTLADLPPLPKNFVVKNHIPQLEVLQKAALFITHAGMNSTNESLYYGVPMVAIPQIDEQRLNALRIQQLGAAIELKKEKTTSKTLIEAAEKILKTPSFYTNAKKIQKTLHEAGGSRQAAKEIINYLILNE